MGNKQNEKPLSKEFGLTNLAVNNVTSVMILTLLIVVLGFNSYVSMPKEQFPEIVIPTIYVGTAYPGNSPVDMENLVTRPIEKEIKSVNGVKDIKSTSVQDYSTVIVEFNADVKVEKALQDVKDAVDRSKSELPNDLPTDPGVRDVNLSNIPIMFINIAGNYDVEVLRKYAEYLQDEIEKLSEISEAPIRGTREREVKINADLYQMEARRVTFTDIENAIRAENVSISGGNLLVDEFRRSVRVVGEFTGKEEMQEIVVKNEDGNIVYLKDVAEVQVKDSFKERESYSRSSKLPVVTINIVKRSGENLLDASDKIKTIIEKAQKERFPADLEIFITNDQSKQTRADLSNLENSIISGVILVVLVLLFFMGLRNALFVGVAIPLSMFMSFMILNAFGVTLNLMVLFSLILALGMLVDNGIVVVENIYRLLEEGKPLKDAIKQGVGEIALPIIASTATTVVAFVPLAFWSGIIGEFMKFLPITLIITLSSSLFVALVINPALAVLFMKGANATQEKPKLKGAFVKQNLTALIFVVLALLFFVAKWTGQAESYTMANLLVFLGLFMLANRYLLSPATAWFQNKALVRLETQYSRFVSFALAGRRPYYFLAGTFVMFVLSIMLLGVAAPKVELFPSNDPAFVNIFVEKPIGTDIENTNKLAEQIESEVIAMMKPYGLAVESIIAQVGEGTSEDDMGGGGEKTPNKAKITVSFADFKDRQGVSSVEVMEEIREAMKKYPGVQITVEKNRNGPPVGKPINIEVSGEDYDKLIALTEGMKQYLVAENIPGIEEFKYDLETGKPEMLIEIDREKARRFGLSTATIATEIRTALFGKEISKYKEGEDDYPIQLRLKDAQRYDVEALMNMTIIFRNNKGQLKEVPISAVANIRNTSSYGSVKRKDLDRVISIYSNVKEGYNATEIVARLKVLMQDYQMPEGYSFRFTGEQEEQEKSFKFLVSALLLAVGAIFLIIVSQFNSISSPFIIMGSVLFSTIGVFLGLVIFQMNFIIIMTGIGIISLAGVVVNNAIVLIDYANLTRTRRKAELGIDQALFLPMDEIVACIVQAGKTRLRPVLLTAITTVLGLIPLATGLNIDFFGLLARFDPDIYSGGDNATFWGPMAWTVIFGLTFATFLTLVIVPVMYLIADRMKASLKGRQTAQIESDASTATNTPEKEVIA